METPNPSDLLAAVVSLKDLALAAFRERDAQKLAALQLDYTKRLLDLQTVASQFLGELSEQTTRIAILEETVRDLRAAKLEKERYQLAQLARRPRLRVPP